MPENFNNLDVREKENFMRAIGNAQTAAGDYANTTGDSFTGLVNFTTITSSGNASLSSVNTPTLKVTNMALTGTASVTAADIPTLSVTDIALTGAASIVAANIPTLRGAVAGSSPVTVRRTAPGSISIGVLRISGNSTASQAVLEFFEKGFISITSTVLTTVANTDYAIVVQVGTETRYLPLFQAAAIVGAAAY